MGDVIDLRDYGIEMSILLNNLRAKKSKCENFYDKFITIKKIPLEIKDRIDCKKPYKQNYKTCFIKRDNIKELISYLELPKGDKETR